MSAIKILPSEVFVIVMILTIIYQFYKMTKDKYYNRPLHLVSLVFNLYILYISILYHLKYDIKVLKEIFGYLKDIWFIFTLLFIGGVIYSYKNGTIEEKEKWIEKGKTGVFLIISTVIIVLIVIFFF